MHSSVLGFRSKISTLSVGLTIVMLWLLMHGYHGLTGDGQIYAFQAFARIHRQLSVDLYLQNTSQDQYTIFSPLYAWFIGAMGLENAARFLTIVFTVWFTAAAWNLACAVTQRDDAWLAVAVLMIISGSYGGSGVFHIAEPYLTARLPAESMIITALACQVRGRKRLALSVCIGAMFVHPLIALPGLLLVVSLLLPTRINVIGAAGGVTATLGIAIVTTLLPVDWRVLTVMDAPWLEVVRERSQFLLLQLWSTHDWELNTRPFISLAFTAIAVRDERLRRFCVVAGLVGIAGLAIALIASLMGPIAILVQGQAWRWLWITVLVSALLLPVTVFQLCRDKRCGPLCAILLVSSWTLLAVNGTACISIALVLWFIRTYINPRAAAYLRWASAALGAVIGAWILVKSRTILSPAIGLLGHAPFDAAQIRDVFGLEMPAVVFAAGSWWWIRANRTIWGPTVLSAMLIAGSIFMLPAAFRQSHTLASDLNVDEFTDWANAIPPTSTVLVAPSQDAGAFVWFTLLRPNYSALSQSAGVVFSRTTALEVERRSQVLLPLMDPNWKILTRLRANSGNKSKGNASTRPLTAESLTEVCSDLQLGFVISPQDVGFEPLRHAGNGVFKDWNLYDCRRVRLGLSTI